MFTPCSILGAKKRRATVFIPRAAFGNFLCLAWFELFSTFFQNEKSWKKRRKHETKTKPKAHPYGPLVVAASPFPFLLKYDGFWCFSDSKIQPDLKKNPAARGSLPLPLSSCGGRHRGGWLDKGSNNPKIFPAARADVFRVPYLHEHPRQEPSRSRGALTSKHCSRRTRSTSRRRSTTKHC